MQTAIAFLCRPQLTILFIVAGHAQARLVLRWWYDSGTAGARPDDRVRNGAGHAPAPARNKAFASSIASFSTRRPRILKDASRKERRASVPAMRG